MIKKMVLLLFAIGFSCGLMAQNKKTIAKYGINVMLETVTEEGRTVNDLKKIFNKEGEVTQEINYDKTGAVKDITSYTFDKSGNCILETVTENEKVVERKIIKYDLSDEKTEELIYDNENKLEKRNLYFYNAKGLKIEKRTLDSSGKVISSHKFIYQ